MSEAARQYPAPETDSRPVPGPLRDWLASIRNQSAPAVQVRPSQEETAEAEPAETAEPVLTVAEPAWSPRVVETPEAHEESEAPSAAAEGEEISELIAENLMLKGKLSLEDERYEELQAMLAQEVRDLRRHVQDEMAELEEIRDERDAMRDERDAVGEERDALRETCESLRAQITTLRVERDLWQARSEALAQPLFQKR